MKVFRPADFRLKTFFVWPFFILRFFRPWEVSLAFFVCIFRPGICYLLYF